MPETPTPNDGWNGIGTGWAVTSTLIAGMLVVGGLGLLVDLIVGTHKIFLGGGLVLGAAAGVYIVYLRYGKGSE